jgi:hypothetical protein
MRLSDGRRMLLKLYKRDGDTMLYWEAWDENDDIVVHFGELGQMGETTTIPLPEFEPPETAIIRQAEEARAAGFAEIEHEDLFELVVQYPVKDMGTPDDVEFAAQVEDLLNDVLGWTGLGHCDGHDIGSDTLNVYAYVVDPNLALEPLVKELTETNLLREAVIAYQDKEENFVVLHPPGWTGIFNY